MPSPKIVAGTQQPLSAGTKRAIADFTSRGYTMKYGVSGAITEIIAPKTPKSPPKSHAHKRKTRKSRKGRKSRKSRKSRK